MVRTHKIRMYPNKTQKLLLDEYFHYARFNYNRALDTWQKLYNDGENPNARSVRDKIKADLNAAINIRNNVALKI